MERKPVTKAIIYKVTNLLNEKIYIGKRLWGKQRFLNTEYYGSGKYIQRAIIKYGKENFKREVLLECNKLNINKKEKEYIAFYKSLSPNGYNIGLGGEGDNGGQNKGKKWTKEHKLKISKGRKGKNTGDSNHMKRPEVKIKFEGEKSHFAKLTNEIVLKIRKSSLSRKEISKIYNVSPVTISHIRLRRTWKHI